MRSSKLIGAILAIVGASLWLPGAASAQLLLTAAGGGVNYTPPLNSTNLEAAYSGRQLVPAYTTNKSFNILRVSDSAQEDVGFVHGTFDTTAAQAFGSAVSPWSPINAYTWYDQSGNTRDATLYSGMGGGTLPDLAPILVNGRPAISTGEYNAGLQFNFLEAAVPITITGDQTLFSIFRASDVTASHGEIIGCNGNNVGIGIGIGLTGVAEYYHNTISTVDTGNYLDGRVHVMVVTVASGTMTMYVDGAVTKTATAITNLACTANLAIGSAPQIAAYPSNTLTGAIAEAGIYSRAWSSGEVAAYTANAQAFYGTDSYATALVGSHSLKFIREQAVTAGSILTYERTQPWSGYAAVQMMTGIPLGGMIFTNVPATGPAFPGYELWFEKHGRPVVRVINTINTNYIDVLANISILDGKPHVVGATYDGSSTAAGVKIYVDGVLTNMTVRANTLSASIIGGTQTMYFGAQDGHLDFAMPGREDDIHIDNVARSATYMQAMTSLANIPACANDASNVLCYQYEDGPPSTTTADGSASGFTGTLTSVGQWAP